MRATPTQPREQPQTAPSHDPPGDAQTYEAVAQGLAREAVSDDFTAEDLVKARENQLQIVILRHERRGVRRRWARGVRLMPRCTPFL